MLMKWNEEQNQAINSVGKNILVSASAGAGKTAVLVERLIKRCLIDHIELDCILAMTFTEAAANEMKKRLSFRLNEEYEKMNADKEYIKRQLILLQNAQISTIHSFCLNLIKKNYTVLGLDPAIINNILDEGAIALAKENAFEKIMNEMIQEYPADFFACAQYFSSRSEDFDSLKDAVLLIAKTAKDSANELAWYNTAKENYQIINTQSDINPTLLFYFMESYRVDIETQINYLDELKTLCMNHYPDAIDVLATIDIRSNFIIHALESLNKNNLDAFIHSFRNALTKEIKLIRKAEDFKKIREALNKHSKQCATYLYDFETLKKDSNSMQSIILTLVEFAHRTSIQFNKNKLEQKGLDFDDMEHFAFQILSSKKTNVASFYQNEFEEILVDEFQDTNTTQNEIVNLISRGNNVFRVGDVKQSIYRFRKAKPDLMRKLNQDENTENIYLSYNYRSNHSIVEFNNDLFDICMNISGCKDAYTQYDHVKAGTPRQFENDYPVEFYGLNYDEISSNIDNDDEADDEENLAQKQIKARFIAHKILDMKKNSSFKKWSDYVILTKSHKDKNVLREAFEFYNIPYSIYAKEGFYQSECCHIILSMLRLIEEIDEISLLAVLLSPLYNTTDNEIVQLRLAYSSLSNACVQTNHPIIKDIQTCKTILNHDGLTALLNKISLINNLVEDGFDNQQRTNFDLLFEKALSFEKTSGSLRQFIQQIDINLDEKSNEAVALGPDEDVVKSMTIHHSKGLQFNVVFYWSTSKNPNLEKKDALLIDSELGFGVNYIQFPFRYKRPTLQRMALEFKNSMEELEENIRVLYVALTRPENKLIIVDNVKSPILPEPITRALLNKRKGNTNLLLSALSQQENFAIHYVDELEKIETPLRDEIMTPNVHRYEYEKNTLPILTPSSTEKKLIPSLSFAKESGAIRGTLIHKLIETLPNYVWSLSDFTDSECSDGDIQKLIYFSNSDLYKQCLTMKIEKEFPFTVKRENDLLQGTIDFLAYNDNEVILIDFKTDQNSTEKELIDHYQSQLNLYHEALKVIFPNLLIKIFLYSFELGHEILINS